MNQSDHQTGALRQRFEELRPELRRRLPAIALTLFLEALLILALLSLGSARREISEMRDSLVAFTSPETQDPDDSEEAPSPAAAPEAAPTQTDQQSDAEPANLESRTPLSPPLPVPRPILRNDFSLENVPRQTSPSTGAKPQAYGPPDTPAPGDTPRIAGSGPNGEPLYAARWYRRPYDDELSGYLSTARGPGWGQVDCRTAPDFRVVDCVVAGETPQGSGIASAVQSAAWQFKVRPPQKGGRPLVGEWVRIRIYYETAPGAATGLRWRD